MTTQDTTSLLAQLRGIHLPQAPAEPPVWPVVVALTLLTLILLSFLVRHLRNRNSWVKQANRELDSIQQGSRSHAPQRTAVLLKRIVLTHEKSEAVKHLSGERWLKYLDNFFSTRFFSEGDGRVFGADLYKNNNHNLSPESYKIIKTLIRRHNTK